MSLAAPPTAPRRGLPAIVLVTRREMLVRLRSRVFLGSTTVMVLVVVVGIVGFSLVGGSMAAVRVGFGAGTRGLEPAFIASTAALGQRVAVSDVADDAKGRAEVSTGDIDVFVSGSATAPTAVVEKYAPSLVQAALERAVLVARLEAAGLPPAAVASAVGGSQVPVVSLEEKKPGLTQDLAVGLAVGILLWIVIGLYGSQVAQGVVEEKASRIVELLLATIPPSRLLAGKIIGIGLVALVQVGLVALAALVANAATHVLTTPALELPAVLAYCLWFLLGFLFYAAGSAALAVLVSRPEEVQSAIAPFAILQIAAYLLAYVYLANPSQPLAVVASVLPPFAPILIPVRIASGDLPVWQQGLALVLIVAAIVGLIWLAARIYANSAMRIGSRLRFMDAFRG